PLSPTTTNTKQIAQTSKPIPAETKRPAPSGGPFGRLSLIGQYPTEGRFAEQGRLSCCFPLRRRRARHRLFKAQFEARSSHCRIRRTWRFGVYHERSRQRPTLIDRVVRVEDSIDYGRRQANSVEFHCCYPLTASLLLASILAGESALSTGSRAAPASELA